MSYEKQLLGDSWSSAPAVELCARNLPQAVDRRRLPSDGTSGYFGSASQDVLGGEGIGRRVRLHSDDPDTWIVLRSIVDAITEVAKPGL